MSSDHAARLFPVDSPFAARDMKGRLEAARIEKIAALQYAQDWPDFKKRVGEVHGLEEALRICNELDQNERGN